MSNSVGKVYLVGAGPGAAGLLTRRASRVLELADVVVYDRLVLPRILNYANKNADFVYVGKEPSKHIASQEEIEELLVQFAKKGKNVARLKGGDPFVFGRGGEEAQTLVNHGISFEVIPGVSSAIGVPAYAGIPLTHRNYSAMFTVLSGHRASADIRSAAKQLQNHEGTVVILMGVGQLESIVADLIGAGIASSTPVALIRNGTWGSHEVLTSSLRNVVEEVQRAQFESPAVIVVGQTVALRESLSWFEQLPLFGKRVVIATDTIDEGLSLADEMESLGAEVFDFALERQLIPRPHVFDHLRKALLEKIPVCVFVESVLGAHVLIQFLKQNQIDLRTLTHLWIGAGNDSVNQVMLEGGLRANFVGKIPSHRFAKGTSLSANISSWLGYLGKQVVPSKVIVHYELPPYEHRFNTLNIEQMIHYFIPNSILTMSPFYGIRYESEAVSSLLRNWRKGEAQMRVVSKTAFQVLQEMMTRKGVDLHEYPVQTGEVRAAL